MSALSFDLTGQSALVTGGTSGIGKAIAEALLDAGAGVVVGSRKAEKVEAAQKDLSAGRDGSKIVARHLDVTDRASIDAALQATADAFGRVDILVNCAGANLKKPTIDIEEDEHRFIMEVNYFGPFYASQAFARLCEKQGAPDATTGGYSIVNVCSVTSFLALSEVTTYACSKGALLALTRQLAIEWPRLYGIRVNGIALTTTFTDFTFAVWKNADELVPFTKAYSGLTDPEFWEITRWVRRNTLERFGPVRSVKPIFVFEIAFEGIQRSKRHKSGVALRFPRIKRWRKDKPIAEANTLEDLHAMLEAYG